MCQKYLVFLFFMLYSFLANADENNMYQEIEIKFSQTSLTVKQALDELSALPEVNVVYKGSETFLDHKLILPSDPISVEEALRLIEKQAPVDIVFSNNYVIVKSRKLKESYELKGSVKDAETSETLIAANVYIPGTTRGTATDINGEFSLHLAPGNYELEIRYLGYKNKRFNVNLFEDKKMILFLEATQQEIKEVYVAGSFTEMEILEKGRPIETIESKTIDQLNTNDVNDALHGRLNGVWTTKVSGAPGDHHRIRIRGINSIFGSADPLYVVDGAIIPIVNFDNIGISDLNSHDIEKIIVLKDASSTALYGNLGSNGVILIETKKGGGATQFNFGVKQGVQSSSKRYSLMNAEKFLNTLHYSDSINRTDFYRVNELRHEYEKYPTYLDSLGNVLAEDDFQNELFQTGRISEYQLSATGNIKSINYFLSGNYYKHKGVITNSKYNKYTFTANLSKVISNKISIRLLYKGSHQEDKNTLDNYLGNNVILKGINYEPAYKATPDSFLRKTGRMYYNDVINNSVATLADHTTSPDDLFYGRNKIKTNNANSLNAQGFYNFNKALSFRALMSLTIRNQVYASNIQKSFSNYDYPDYYMFEDSQSDYGKGNQLKSDENFIYFCQHYDLNYTKQHKRHLFNVLLRYRNFKDNAYWAVDSVSNVYYDQIEPTDDVFMRGSQAIFGEKGSVLRSINSGIININYNFADKYFFSAISNFETIKENEYRKNPDFFYSLACSWDLAKEGFMHVPSFVEVFNLSANLGKSGNFPLNSLADDLFTFSGEYTARDKPVDAVYISNLANSNLSQESVFETNFGTEISLFKERLIFTADYYKKYYSNLLIKRTIPLYYGGGMFYQNIGQMQIQGMELSLEAIPIERTDFYWSSRLGFSTNQQRVTKLLDTVPITFNNTDILILDFVAKENEVLGSIIGYKYIGKWSDVEQSLVEGETPRYFENSGLAYLKTDTLDMRNITEADKTIIGNSIPDFTFSWINSFAYKNFSLELMWYGAIGVDKYNATKASTYISGLSTEVRNIVLDSMNYHSSRVFYESSFFVEDASFVRLKTLTFSYRPYKKLVSKIAMEFSVSFENLITLTPYSGYDPEAAIYTNNNFTDNAIDKGAYPNPKGVYFSINLSY
jgi:TonB-linked SusC/RagA family outer membrane protein